MEHWMIRLGAMGAFLALAAWVRPLAFLGGPYRGGLPNLSAALVVAVAAFLLEEAVRRSDPRRVAGGAAGLVGAGLVGSALVWTFSGATGPNVAARILVYLPLLWVGWAVGSRAAASSARGSGTAAGSGRDAGLVKAVDTSVLIDGRLPELARTGFLEGPLLVPEFVLRELQGVADSEDPALRARGRRGLEALATVQEEAEIAIDIVSDDPRSAREVDEKLVHVAEARGAALLTLDYNLNRVASIRGVRVLNLNDLAHALRPALIPGETLSLRILREGKEPGQGVAYLEDGTMVVVDDARNRIGQDVHAEVTGSLQTSAGRMFFARLRDDLAES
jgi:uncharacterized protein YacL